jgi:hypothetical protein
MSVGQSTTQLLKTHLFARRSALAKSQALCPKQKRRAATILAIPDRAIELAGYSPDERGKSTFFVLPCEFLRLRKNLLVSKPLILKGKTFRKIFFSYF